MVKELKIRSVDEVIKDAEKYWIKKIRKGEWGHWKYNPDNLTLQFDKTVGGDHSYYEVDLERCTNSAEILDWIFQVHGKPWCGNKDIADLLRAFDDLMEIVQSKVCSGGKNTKFNFRKHLIEKINPIIKKK